MNDILLVAFFS